MGLLGRTARSAQICVGGRTHAHVVVIGASGGPVLLFPMVDDLQDHKQDDEGMDITFQG